MIPHVALLLEWNDSPQILQLRVPLRVDNREAFWVLQVLLVIVVVHVGEQVDCSVGGEDASHGVSRSYDGGIGVASEKWDEDTQ